MSRTVLLTIGRLPKALDLARSFADAGWRVIVADPFKRHLTASSNRVARSVVVTSPVDDRAAFERDLLAIVAEEGVNLVVPVSEETMFVATLAGRLPDGVRLYAMPQEKVLRLHDKQRFIETCISHDLDVPDTAALDHPGADAIATSGDYVVKPVHSCSGRGVRFFKRGAPLPADANGERHVVQRKVDGDLYSTFSITHQGRVLTTVVYRAAVMSGTVAVCFERVPEQSAILDWVSTFALKENYSGFVSFDVIVDKNGRAFAIECNPRVTSGIHFLHPDGIAAAIVEPETAPAPRFRDNLFMQQFYPCLTETQKSVFKPLLFKKNLKHLVSARDVTWDWRDPMPLLAMPFTASQIIARAVTRGQTFGEASTYDISWREP